VYRELAAMAASGLVEVGPPGPRDRKPHTITDSGRAAFARWLAAELAADHVRIPLLLTIAFAQHLPPGRLAEMIAAQRAEHECRLCRYRAAREEAGSDDRGSDDRDPAGREPARADTDRSRRATLAYGLRHERAVLDWLDELPAILGLDPGATGTRAGGTDLRDPG
jgi:DNA-binding PadR family transcriptional regulator